MALDFSPLPFLPADSKASSWSITPLGCCWSGGYHFSRQHHLLGGPPDPPRTIGVYEFRVDINGSQWSTSFQTGFYIPENCEAKQGDISGARWEWWNWGISETRDIRWFGIFGGAALCNFKHPSMLTTVTTSLALLSKLLGGIVTLMGYHWDLTRPSSSSKWAWNVGWTAFPGLLQSIINQVNHRQKGGKLLILPLYLATFPSEPSPPPEEVWSTSTLDGKGNPRSSEVGR